MNVAVVGVTFGDFNGCSEQEMKTMCGQRVSLVHNPDNRHDSQAIAVMFQGRRLGYIAKDLLPRAHSEKWTAQLFNIINAGRSSRLNAIYAKIELHTDSVWRVLNGAGAGDVMELMYDGGTNPNVTRHVAFKYTIPQQGLFASSTPGYEHRCFRVDRVKSVVNVSGAYNECVV